MNEKTPGEIAYEAYCEETGWRSLVSGETLPPFENQGPRLKAAWETAAKAVLNAEVEIMLNAVEE